MAATKKTTTKKTKSTPEAPISTEKIESSTVDKSKVQSQDIVVDEETLKLLQKIAALEKTKKISDPNREIELQSNFAGTLIYTSKKTGETWEWSRIGDINYVPLEELQTMRNTQRDFFINNWVKIIDDDADEILKNLRINQYYTNFVDLTNLEELFTKKVDKIIEQVSGISQEAKTTLAIATKRMITNGELRDIVVIRALSDAIGFDLLQR